MGEIDLQHEIRVDNESGRVYRQRQCRHIRRLYSAKVGGRQSSMTVAIYQGDHAEEVSQICHFLLISPESISKEWRRDVARYMSIRQVPGKAFYCFNTHTLYLAIRISFSFIRQRVRTTYML
jgi:hypothetical protein